MAPQMPSIKFPILTHIQEILYNAPVKRKYLCLLILFLIISQFSRVFPQQIDMDAVHAEDNIRWGVYAFHRTYYNEAIRSFETALTIKPANNRIRYWLGKSLLKSGYEEAALNEWNTILDSGVQDPLLGNAIQVLNFRRGIGAEVAVEERMVVTRVHDPGGNQSYPFSRPTSVKPRQDGSVFVVAYGSNEVFTITANGNVRDIMKGSLSPGGAYDHPFDIVETGDGTLFISEYEGHRIAKCKPNGEKIQVLGKKGTGDDALLGPQFLALDSKGYLYVTDWGNKRVCKYDQEGNFILSFGSKTTGTGKMAVLAGPTGLTVVDDRILVADKRQQRIAVFDQHGNYLRSFAEGALWGPEGLSVQDNRILLICDTDWFRGKTRLLQLDLADEKLTPVPGLDGYTKRLLNSARDLNGNLVAVDFDLNRVIMLSKMSDLYTGYSVEIQRIESTGFPEVTVDIAVEDKAGNPVYGLEVQNFFLSEPENPVTGLSMYSPVHLQENCGVVLLVEKSPAMEKRKSELKKAVADLLPLLSHTSLFVMAAGETPVIEIDTPAGITDIQDKVTGGKYSSQWNLGPGVRLAGSKLLASRYRRVIIYISSGATGNQPFKQYSLLELKDFLENNYISFFCIHLGPGNLPEELVFLCEKTGGNYYTYYNPSGLLPIRDDILAQPDPRYILSFQSHTFPEFGKKYIELDVEVILNKISGRDKLGYYAPLE